MSPQFEGKWHLGHCAGLHSCATFRRVALPDVRGRSGVALVHERSGPSGSRVARPRPSSLSAVDDPTRLFDIQTDSLSSSLPRRESIVHEPHTIRMARFCNFMNAPITDSGRFSPEPLTTKVDKKSQKNWNLRAADPDARAGVGGKESRSSDPFVVRAPLASRIETGGVRREVSSFVRGCALDKEPRKNKLSKFLLPSERSFRIVGACETQPRRNGFERNSSPWPR